VSRPEPGPLTKTSTFFIPCSMARRAAASAAICAAYGVDLREPLKPTWPAEAHEITAPVGSAIEMMVLLNVLLMWAAPPDTFCLTLLRTLVARVLGGMLLSYVLGVLLRPSSCLRRCASVPCGTGRWSSSAGRAPGGHGGAAGPRRCRSRPCGGRRPRPRDGGHLRAGRWTRGGRGGQPAARRSGP